MIQPFVQKHIDDLRRICARRRVRKLELFGSAATQRFDPTRSDLDFLVEFEDLGERGYFDAYFGLLEDLQSLFGIEVDLVMARAIKNPYFLQSIQRDRIELYAA